MNNDNQSLQSKAVKGVIWSAAERLAGQVVTFALALALARLVTPNDYGVLTIVMVFITLANVLIDGGFANALVRKNNCTEADKSTVFYFNIVISIIAYIAIFFTSPIFANMYGNEELTPLIRVASIVVIIHSLSIVQQAILTSNIDFKKQTIVSLTSQVISGIIGIILAYQGYGVWALVAQNTLASVFRTILLWIFVRWRPSLIFSKESFSDLFGYSSKLVLSSIIITSGNEINNLLLGKFFNTTNLGYYNYSKRLSFFPAMNLAAIVQRVLFPTLSRIQDNESLMTENFRKTLIVTMSIIVPIMFSMSVLSEPIVRILLTDVWLPVIPYLKITAITFAFYPLLIFNNNILYVKKRSDLLLKVDSINIFATVTIILLARNENLLFICILLCVKEFLNFLLYSYFIGLINSYGTKKQFKDMLSIFIFSAISSIISANLLIPYIPNNFLQICVGFASIFALFTAMNFLFKREFYNLFIEHVRKFIRPH